MSVHFRYVFDPEGGAPASELLADRPLFGLLRAIRNAGSLNLAAERLQMSYRHLWGLLREQESRYGGALVLAQAGKPARLSELGQRLLAAEALLFARHLPQVELLAGQFDNELLAAVHPERPRLRLAASHDLLLAGLRNLAQAQSELLIDIDFVGSAPALTRLNQRECLLAGIHLPLETPAICQRGSHTHLRVGRQLRLGEHKLIRMVRRELGLIVAPGNPLGIGGLGDLKLPGLRYINRQAGAGTRLMFDDLIARHGLHAAEIQGYAHEEPSHLGVAAAVAAGIGDCALGLRAAAERLGLGFIPLLHDHYFLVCSRDSLETPPLQALRKLLASADFAGLVQALPGYDASDAGQVISLRHSLPWYK